MSVRGKPTVAYASTPKLLVLVSMYPIYNQMGRFLNMIQSLIMAQTLCPIENILINLIFEFPHPGEKFVCISEFWKAANKHQYKNTINKFVYEDHTYQAYCEIQNFKTFQQIFNDKKRDKIWDILENMLYNMSIILISDSSQKLVQIVEVFKNLIYPFMYQGLIIPYDPNPSDNLLMAKLPYLIGLRKLNQKVHLKTKVVNLMKDDQEKGDEELIFINEDEIVFSTQQDTNKINETDNAIKRAPDKREDKKTPFNKHMNKLYGDLLYKALKKIEKAEDQTSMQKAVNQLRSCIQDSIFKGLLICKTGNELIKKVQNKQIYSNLRPNKMSENHFALMKKFVASQTFINCVDSLRNENPAHKRVFEFIVNYREKFIHNEEIAVSRI